MLSKLGLVSALLPAALACLGYEGGVPTPTDHVSSSSVIRVEAGEVFDGGWKKYDRGSGACNEQTEGGKFPSPLESSHPRMAEVIAKPPRSAENGIIQLLTPSVI